MLQSRVIAASDDPRHGYRLERQGASLLDNDLPVANAGLIPIVGYWLLRRGHDVRLMGRR